MPVIIMELNLLTTIITLLIIHGLQVTIHIISTHHITTIKITTMSATMIQNLTIMNLQLANPIRIVIVGKLIPTIIMGTILIITTMLTPKEMMQLSLPLYHLCLKIINRNVVVN
jgi:hypothetical protein